MSLGKTPRQGSGGFSATFPTCPPVTPHGTALSASFTGVGTTGDRVPVGAFAGGQWAFRAWPCPRWPESPVQLGPGRGSWGARQPLWGGPLPPWGLRTSCLWVGFSFFHKLSGRATGRLAHTAHRPILLSSFNSGKTVLFRLHIKRSLNEMKSSSFNKQHKYLILF